MPTVTRTRTIAAAPERIWTEIADPERLVAWWPRAQRVEEATGKAWTLVLGSGKGDRALRASVPGNRRYEVGSAVGLTVDPESLHFFDAAGNRIAA